VSDFVYLDPVAPEVYVLDLTPGTSGVDLSTVSAAVLVVQEPDGTQTTWSAVRSNITSTTLTLTHAYAAGDVDQAGEFVIYAALTIPSGTVRSIPQPLIGRGKFEV
jgi:hypothetical protein